MKKYRSLLLLACSATLWAQPVRDEYRKAYETWRQAEPTLEHDAANAGPDYANRVDRAAKAAQDFNAARIAFLAAIADETEQQRLWLENEAGGLAAVLEQSPSASPLVQSATQHVTGIIASYAKDADPVFQPLRQALERERAALNALGDALQAHQNAVNAVSQANGDAQQTLTDTLAAYKEVATQRTQTVDRVTQEAAQFQTYYKILAAGAAGIVSATANPPATSTVNPPVKETEAAVTPLPRTPVLAARAAAAPGVSLARYVGAWTFPNNGQFKGGQPEFVDLVVHETDGVINGTLFGRFVLPAGSPGDPTLRFDFTGPIQTGRVQHFPLMTSDGAEGFIDLIPGPAFNLIEINFQTDPKPNKVRNGNFILVKK